MTKLRESFKTYKNVFDEKTLRVLFKLESEGYFEDLASPVSIGKESNVFTARRPDGTYVILKIYRVNVADFKRMYRYIAADQRFEGLSNQHRKVIFAWAQREYRNLLIASKAGANVPVPYAVRDNVLVMEMIGEKNHPARRLKDSKPKNVKKFSDKLIHDVKLFCNAGFVHGDLSEYNILNYNDEPYIIDFSHGINLDAPNADKLLERDVQNLCRYFSKFNIKLDVKKILLDLKENGI